MTGIKFRTLCAQCTDEKFRIEIVYSYAHRQGNAVIVFNLDVKWLAWYPVVAGGFYFLFFPSSYLVMVALSPHSFSHSYTHTE